jgi:hypothetical protein
MDVITHVAFDLGVVEPALGEEFTFTDTAGLAHRAHDTGIGEVGNDLLPGCLGCLWAELVLPWALDISQIYKVCSQSPL